MQNNKKKIATDIRKKIKELNQAIKEAKNNNLEVFLKLYSHDEILKPTIQERIVY